MTIELGFLLATTILLTLLWIPYVIGIVKSGGKLTPETTQTLQLPSDLLLWAKRANRAHLNLVEQFGAFSTAVVIAHLVGASSWVTIGAAAIYFMARVVHAIVMIAGISKFNIRTLAFQVSIWSIIAIVVEIIRASI